MADYSELIEAIQMQTAATVEHTKALTTLNGKIETLIALGRTRERVLIGLIVFLVTAVVGLVGVKLGVPAIP